MDTVRELLEQYWIDKQKNKELYTSLRRELPETLKFFQGLLGWTVINNERILKIEKVPARAQSCMGITDFTEIRDYIMLCALLMFLEDKEDNEQFLLSELVDMLELHMKEVMSLDWTLYTHRRSLVRVLKFAEKMGLIDVYEGNSESIENSMEQEILYENTGISRYMTTNFSHSLSGLHSYRDIEELQMEATEADRGHYRVNRVYRQLAASPALYWSRNDDPDGIYLKNQRQWIQKNLEEYLGGSLHIHKNAAFLVMDEEDRFAQRHPRDAMLPEIVLLMCDSIRMRVQEGAWQKRADDCIEIGREEFLTELLLCRTQYAQAWSKEYREMEEHRLVEAVLHYMEGWMMVQRREEKILICPAAGKTAGIYSEHPEAEDETDMEIEEDEDE